MSADIVSCLHLDAGLFSKFIVVKEINGCDNSFIISCILNTCIKNKHAVLLISTHNSLQHYQNIGLKMNYNLQKNMQSGLVDYFDLGEEAINSLRAGGSQKQDSLLKVKEKIISMQQSHEDVNVIIDGLSHLFDLQYTLRDVNIFCKDVIELVKKSTNTFVLCQCNSVDEDDITNTIANLLSHKAHVLVEVENLPSGLSTDVSGRLTIKYLSQNFEIEHMFTLDPKSNCYLFKLFDRGVKLFAPGVI